MILEWNNLGKFLLHQHKLIAFEDETNGGDRIL